MLKLLKEKVLAKKENYPITPGVRVLRSKKIVFEACLYDYEQHGGTSQAAQALGVNEHDVIKTLVLDTEERKSLILLMHGDCEVSLKNFARYLKVKQIHPVDEKIALKLTGYQVGGLGPFGIKKSLPIYMQKTLLDSSHVYINAGKRGFLVKISPQDIVKHLSPELVDVAQD